jgi:hypothetical protein
MCACAGLSSYSVQLTSQLISGTAIKPLKQTPYNDFIHGHPMTLCIFSARTISFDNLKIQIHFCDILLRGNQYDSI